MGKIKKAIAKKQLKQQPQQPLSFTVYEVQAIGIMVAAADPTQNLNPHSKSILAKVQAVLQAAQAEHDAEQAQIKAGNGSA